MKARLAIVLITVFGLLILNAGVSSAEPAKVTLVFASNMPEVVEGKDGTSLAKLATLLRRERASAEHVVFIHGGDSLGPSLLGAFDQGAHTIDLLNALKPSAMAIAKRELMYGKDVLSRRIEQADFPILSTNLSVEGAHRTLMLQAGPLKIGLLAATAPAVATEYLVEGLSVLDPETTISEAAADLRAKGADLVVMVLDFHLPNSQTFRKIHGIDVLLLSDRDGDRVVVDDLGVFAVQGGLENAVVLDIRFESVGSQGTGGQVEWSASGRLSNLSTLPPDEDLSNRLRSYRSGLFDLLDKKIGVTQTALDTTRKAVRTGETAFGNFVADVLRVEMDGDVALINGGSFHGDRTYTPGDVITWGTLLKELPFLNHPTLIRISGQQLMDAVENGLSHIEDAVGRFPHLAACRRIRCVCGPHS